MVTPVFSKSGKNGNESIAFKSSNVARAPMKSVQVQVTHQSVHIPTQVNQFTSKCWWTYNDQWKQTIAKRER